MPKLIIILFLLLVLAACGGEVTPTATPQPTEVVVVPATDMAVPTSTHTPTATATLEPTTTNTATPAPTFTATLEPTPEETATKSPSATPTVRASATPGVRVNATATGAATTAAEPTKPNETTTDAPLDALTILLKSEEAQNKVETLTQEQVQVTASTGFTQTQIMECQREVPANAFCEMTIIIEIADYPEPITTTAQMVYQDGLLWLREDSDGEWEQLPEDFLQQMGMADQLEFEMSINPDFIVAAEIVGEREWEGIPVYEIEVELDSELYFAEYFSDDASAQIIDNLAESFFHTILWISKEDFITRHQELTLTLITVDGETITTSGTVTNRDINEPVDIPDPAAEN
ncbi:MAG: hypothetical protein KJ069_13925 [Anaerolineae bacterium]|nr:hypothetical protein [Anaerolineae bacterium]